MKEMEAIMEDMEPWYKKALLKSVHFKSEDEGACRVWRLCENSSGYPQHRVTTQGISFTQSVHRLMYWLAGGTPTAQISHLCHNKRCVRLEHLRDESAELNSMRNTCNKEKFCKGHTDAPPCMV